MAEERWELSLRPVYQTQCLLVAALTLGLLGCNDAASNNSRSTQDQGQLTQLQGQLAQADGRLSALEQHDSIMMKYLMKQIEDLRARQTYTADFLTKTADFMTKIANQNLPAYVETDNQNYGLASTTFGSFTVSAERAEPYLDGYKVTLMIGNPTDATYNGATVRIAWGQAFSLQKNFDIAATFPPGRYTRYEFALTPAKAADIKTIQVSLGFNQMELGVALAR